jgi:hypothetical protein
MNSWIWRADLKLGWFKTVRTKADIIYEQPQFNNAKNVYTPKRIIPLSVIDKTFAKKNSSNNCPSLMTSLNYDNSSISQRLPINVIEHTLRTKNQVFFLFPIKIKFTLNGCYLLTFSSSCLFDKQKKYMYSELCRWIRSSWRGRELKRDFLDALVSHTYIPETELQIFLCKYILPSW